MRTRAAVAALGTLAGTYGLYLLLSRQALADWVEIAAWLAAGVVIHDGLLAPLSIGDGVVISRVVPFPARAPLAVGIVVLSSVTLLAIPVLGRLGARADNPTLLDRNYLLGWWVVVALVAGGVVAGTLLRSRPWEGGLGGSRARGRRRSDRP